jgi:Asp-tRNA(Asn)/Glu-tRNA(Gln) amidotransferase A subunit family amidase
MTDLTSQPLWRLSASEAAEALSAGRLTSEALTRACLARIAARDPELKAWVQVDADNALRQARELDKQPRRGPLHGLPVAIKDMIDTADLPTAYNSPLFHGHRPALDAAAVAILRAAGCVILGKTETTEFAAAGRDAPTGNPHNLAHTSGGSSAGSAAAVADLHVPLALGTQTGGSLIRPASFCGAFAFKPSWGQVSREGAKFYSVSLDTIGFYGRSVADLDLMAELYQLPGDPAAVGDVAGRRFALCRSPEWPHAEEGTKLAMAEAAERLRAAGAEVVDLELPAPFAELNRAHRRILFGEGRSAFLPLYLNDKHRLHDDFHHRVENRDGFTPDELLWAYDMAAECRKAFDAIAAGFDAVVTPSAPGEAPEGRRPGDPVFNQPWTLLHTPVVHLPVTTGPKGLPVGVSLVGRRLSDRRLLAIAAAAAEVVSPHQEA